MATINETQLTELIELGKIDDAAAFQRATAQLNDQQLALLNKLIDNISRQTTIEDELLALDVDNKAIEEELLAAD